jgi:hypothetical protein
MDDRTTRNVERFRRSAAVAEQQRFTAAQLRQRAEALHEAADQRIQRSAEIEAATDRRLRRGISTTIRDAAQDKRQ